jgi:hypothetical protein
MLRVEDTVCCRSMPSRARSVFRLRGFRTLDLMLNAEQLAFCAVLRLLCMTALVPGKIKKARDGSSAFGGMV